MLFLHDARRTKQFAFDLVENAIDEFAAVLGGKFFGDVHGFIDAHDRRDIVAEHIASYNAARDARPNPLFPNGRPVVELPPKTGDPVQDFINARNAYAAARPNPLRR